MSINFLNLEKIDSQTIRPDGYKFPKGLSVRVTNPAQEDNIFDPDSYITTSQATKSESPTYVSYTWTATGSFEHTLPENLKGDILIVAGGGAGQTRDGDNGGTSGGGAGGLLYYSDTNGLTGPPGPASANSKTPNGPAVSFSPSIAFTVTVGAGGVGLPSPAWSASGGSLGNGPSGLGEDSSVANTSPDIPTPQHLSLIAKGGGTQLSPSTQHPSTDHGSGAGYYGSDIGQGIPGQGHPGAGAATPVESYGYSAGGGGGAGGPGSSMDMNPRSGKDGNPGPTSALSPGPLSTQPSTSMYARKGFGGGDGLDFDISGTRKTYGAGGAGCGRGVGWFGGSDNLGGRGSGLGDPRGGGFSPWNSSTSGGNGTVNRGSGGGGGLPGGSGGGGVVVIRFNKLTDFEYGID